jgi:hypothetical protein
VGWGGGGVPGVRRHRLARCRVRAAGQGPRREGGCRTALASAARASLPSTAILPWPPFYTLDPSHSPPPPHPNPHPQKLNPVIYDSAVLTLEASGTFWYSDTPDVPNSKWGCSAFPRIATWGR